MPKIASLLLILTICALNCHGYAAENKIPQRIVSLGPFITEEIYLLGAEDSLVGCTTYCIKPEAAKKKEKVGTILEVNLEKVVSLNPDLVLATRLTDPHITKRLEDVGIPVKRFTLAKNFNEMCDHFLEIGRITGKEKKSQEIINVVREKVDAIKSKVTKLPKPKVFVQVGARPLFTAPKDSFVNTYIEYAGGDNIAHDAIVGFYNREEVIKRNPDIIIIITMGVVGEEEKANWQKYHTINAVKNKRIVIIDSYKIGSPTPISFAKTLEEMVSLIHPDKE